MMTLQLKTENQGLKCSRFQLQTSENFQLNADYYLFLGYENGVENSFTVQNC
jgi:hypothetical protein